MDTEKGLVGFLKHHTIIYMLIKEPSRILLEFPHIFRELSCESYFPEKTRKNWFSRFSENMLWLLKYHEINHFYNLYGFDVKEGTNPQNYIDYLSFMITRDKANKSKYSWNNQVVMLRDKYLFYKYMKANHAPVPEVFAVLRNGKLYNEFMEEKSPDFLKQYCNYFVKEEDGECASFILHVKDYEHLMQNWDSIKNRNCILQTAIIQNPAMLELNPGGAINTLRIVTINKDNGVPFILTSVLRVGTVKTGHVDNWAKGGIAVGIESDGHLKPVGFYKPGFGLKTSVHPDSHMALHDFIVPYWKEACELAIHAHKFFYNIRSIGWDIAITENGPCIVEGNDNWEISLMQVADRGLKKDWVDAIS